MQVRITVTNSFDGSTSLPPGAKLTLIDKGVYAVTDSEGDEIDDLGRLSLRFLMGQGLVPASAYLPTIAHNGASGVTVFSAFMGMWDGAAIVAGSPVLRVDPSSPEGGQVGPLALVGPGDDLVLHSNGEGAQTVVISVIPVSDRSLIDTVALAFDGGGGAPPGSQILTVFLDDLATVETVNRTVFADRLSTVSGLSLVANKAVAAGDLTITVSVDGVALTNGVLTLPAGSAAGTIAIATPINGVLQPGSLIAATVGGGNTAEANGVLTVEFRPVV